MLTALFKLVWNTQKSTWTIFLSTKTKFFIILKRFFWLLFSLYTKMVQITMILHRLSIADKYVQIVV